MHQTFNMLHYDFSMPFMVLLYRLNCIVVPILMLPVCVLARLCNAPISCWDWAMYNVFFKLLRICHCVQGTFIDTGFILANHRTWVDFAYDPFISGSAVVGRAAAFWAMLGCSLLGFLENRFIIMSRSKNRNETFTAIRHFIHSKGFDGRRVLFWPEGTRCSHTQLTIEDTRRMIKPGLLKSIYEHSQLPVQIMMSQNKEHVLNEKLVRVGLGQTIYTKLSDAIHPSDFATFEAFFEGVCCELHLLFQALYA